MVALAFHGLSSSATVADGGFDPPAGSLYVALGDSYSAGEGLGGDGTSPSARYYQEPIDTSSESPTENSCHRSRDAYGPIIARQSFGTDELGGVFGFWACSGDESRHVVWPNSPTTPSPRALDEVGFMPLQPGGSLGLQGEQVSHVGVDTRLITLTIGGNDLGFADALRTCTEAAQVNPVIGRVIRVDPIPTITDIDVCESTLESAAASIADGSFAARIGALIDHLQQRAPHALVIIGTYPRIFPNAASLREVKLPGVTPARFCVTASTIPSGIGVAGAAVLREDRMQEINAVQAALASEIVATVAARQDGRVRSVNLFSRVRGPISCALGGANDGQFVNGLRFANDLDLTPVSKASFHPNAAGQERMADEFLTIIEAARWLTKADALPTGAVYEPYSSPVVHFDRTVTARYVLRGGALPPGLSMSASGLISGVPSASGDYTFRVGVQLPLAVERNREFTIRIDAAPLSLLSGGVAWSGSVEGARTVSQVIPLEPVGGTGAGYQLALVDAPAWIELVPEGLQVTPPWNAPEVQSFSVTLTDSSGAVVTVAATVTTPQSQAVRVTDQSAQFLAASEDGSSIALYTAAALEPTDVNGASDLYVLRFGTPLRVGTGLAGVTVSQTVDFSSDGTRFVFSGFPQQLGFAAGPLRAWVGSIAGSAISFEAAAPLDTSNRMVRISPDGTKVGYAAAGQLRVASPAPAGDGTSVLVSCGTGGAAANGAIQTFSFDMSNEYVVYATGSSNLVTGDGLNSTDVFASPVDGSCATDLVSEHTSNPSGGTSQGPVIDGSAVYFFTDAFQVNASAPAIVRGGIGAGVGTVAVETRLPFRSVLSALGDVVATSYVPFGGSSPVLEANGVTLVDPPFAISRAQVIQGRRVVVGTNQPLDPADSNNAVDVYIIPIPEA